MSLDTLRVAHSDAVERSRAAATELAELADAESTTPEDFTAAEERFSDASAAVERSKAAVELRERVEAARAAAPVKPAPEDKTDATVTSEPDIYERNGEHSFFADVYQRSQGDLGAAQRLERHGEFVRKELAGVKSRALNETAGTGGNFVPPKYLQEDWIALARAARPFADAVNHMDLPPGANTLIIPKVATGTAVAAQLDNTTVQSTDMTDSTITIPVITEAGQQDVARQLLERSADSGSSIDTVVFADLLGAYNTAIDVQVLSGSGSGGNVKGVLSNAGRSIVTYTSGSPTAAGLYSKIADAIQRIHTLRFLPPDLIVMHPRRWAWFLAQVDTQNRPLVVPQAQGPFNALGQFDRVASENLVGTLQGLPVIVDASVPTNQGAGTNQDVILVVRSKDLWLMEDPSMPVTKTFEQTLSGTLTIRLQLYGYLAFTSERYNAAISTVEGTGLITPTF